ncbi:MAG: DNA translocase FtsK [bacterium]|nr:DNA translocase FtsK [bacterium]
MAANSGKRRTSSNSRGKSNSKKKTQEQNGLQDEVIMLLVLALSILLLLSNFGLIGSFGTVISGVMFGLFGIPAYIAPVILFFACVFLFANKGNTIATMKCIAAIVLFFILCVFCQMLFGENETISGMKEYYQLSSANKEGGGIIGGAIAKALCSTISDIGTYVVLIILAIACVVLITERSFFGGVKKGSEKIYHTAKDDVQRRKEQRVVREQERALRSDAAEEERVPRSSKKVSGVMLNTTLTKEEKDTEDIHEILPEQDDAIDKINIRTAHSIERMTDEVTAEETAPEVNVPEEPQITHERKKAVKPAAAEKEPDISKDISQKAAASDIGHTYRFPSVNLLKKGSRNSNVDSEKQLKETAKKLQQTLSNFGVNVTITDISQGPTVTRYEMQPEQGVKVSKIVGLTDDIKLNLAATDIRIEAPIPGKAAVGIEVPNKENSAVMFRDLVESKEFDEFGGSLIFAVGKDIAGKTVVADIAKMPHLLIAGATGSGKSVCINTLIMSLLYKSHPDDVKLIMIDPKVVELSVYNNIPHLMIPVVTDPKKAAAALHWGVSEMTERYKKFADMNVRDLKGYNKKVAEITDLPEEERPQKMPQIVIIVDELADLMMVAPGEVEESICRLAQLARAAGIHLIIATQRPSVDVITGLIKANMPSRIAFSVSSGVDSRTILDMIGAEKLLGKGDMLFYPQGYSKPARIQGAFISDQEVMDVVQFLAKQTKGPNYSADVEERIAKADVGQSQSGDSDSLSDRDSYFEDAARFIIDKDKASIGMLQRVFKIGFNRAARIMDQLADAGVVGEEEGTKPRKVLMSMEEFENFVEESV